LIENNYNIFYIQTKFILAFNERNESITMELQDLISDNAAVRSELKKKNSIVEDAVNTITELRNELQSAEDDAEATITEYAQKLETEKETNNTLSGRNKKLMENGAKNKAVHTAQLGSMEKSLNEMLWDAEQTKRQMTALQNENITMEERIAMVCTYIF